MEVDSRARLVRLMRDLVIVQPDGPRQTWDLGDGLVLHVPKQYQKAPQRGTILATGPNVWNLKSGDRVLYSRTAFVGWLELTTETRGPIGLVFHERDILALIEPEGEHDPNR